MKISKRKRDFQRKSLPISRSPPLLACRIKTEADSVFQAFYVAPAQWFGHPTANWSTEGWHGRKKTKQAAGLHSSFAPFPPFALLLSLMFPWLICPPLPTVSLVHFVVLRHEQDADHSAKGKSVIQGKVRERACEDNFGSNSTVFG